MEKTYRCLYEITRDLLQDRWKHIILFHLGRHEVLRYRDLKRAMPDISERMLTKILRELEVDTIISREVYSVTPPKIEYKLTQRGVLLIPLLNQLKEWGEDYFKGNMNLYDLKELDLKY